LSSSDLTSGKYAVKRELLLSIGLLLACYGGFMWLTFDDHRKQIHIETPSSATTTDRETPKSAASPRALPLDRSAELMTRNEVTSQGIEIRPDIVDEEEIIEATASEVSTTPEPPAQRAYSIQSHTVQSLSQIVQQSNDREARVTAVNTLLLMGRKSMIDPAVISALKEAAKVTDTEVSASAISALAEVERETH
jgi:hypothetical protein